MRALAPALLVGALTAGGPAWALDAIREITRHDQRRFGVAEGLEQVSVFALAQTADGYLWVGTDGGLARFDGRRFKTWTSADTPAFRVPRVRALLVDRAGDLWIGTNGGTGLIRRRGERFETFEEQIGRGGSVLCALEDRQGHRWFGTWRGLIEHVAGRFTRHQALGGLDLGAVIALAEDGEGALWLGTFEGAIRLHRGKATHFRTGDDGKPLGNVPALLTDGDGSLWLGTSTGKVFRYQGGDFRLVARAEGGESSGLRALVRDRQGTLWAATDAGLGRHRGDRIEPAPPADRIQTLFEDREETLWLGTGAGLVRIMHGAFASISIDDSVRTRVMAVAAGRDGTIWVGRESGGIVGVRGTERKRFTAGDGLCANHVAALAIDPQDGIWVGGSVGAFAGACRLDPTTGQIQKFELPRRPSRDVVHAITALPDGQVWIGSDAGLFAVEGGNLRSERLDAPGPSEVHAIHQDRSGALWVAAKNGLHVRRDGAWSHLGVDRGLPTPFVFSVDEDAAGNLWLGTMSGFARVRGGHVTAWKQGRGFSNDPVFKVLPDDAGDLWLCSSRGFLRVSRAAIEASDRGAGPLEHTRYGTADGLATDHCDGAEGQSVGWRGAGPLLFFPSGNSVASIDPRRLRTLPKAAQAFVEEVLVDGRPVDRAALARLPPGRGDLQIAYTAPWLAQPERIRFRYRLDPFDSGWVEAGTRRVAFYTQVPPGSYRFQVMAGTESPVAGNAAAATLDLVLAPHLWQTAWFRALVLAAGLAVAVVIVVAIRRREMRTIEERHQTVMAERTRISRDLHDTLAQSFTGISVQLEAATAWMEEAPGRSRDGIDKARALARKGLTDARWAVWALPSEATKQGGLVRALSEIASSLSASVPVRVQVNGQPRPLPAACEAGLLRIGQEALTNAVRHARASNIALDVSFLEDGLLLKVTDDGRGFDPDTGPGEPGHFGLASMRERARAFNGRLEIKSGPGAGTEIAVLVPFAAAQKG